MQLKITTAAGVVTVSDTVNSVVISAAGKITDVNYGTGVAVAAIAAYDGTNTKYELGNLGEDLKMNTIARN